MKARSLPYDSKTIMIKNTISTLSQSPDEVGTPVKNKSLDMINDHNLNSLLNICLNQRNYEQKKPLELPVEEKSPVADGGVYSRKTASLPVLTLQLIKIKKPKRKDKANEQFSILPSIVGDNRDIFSSPIRGSNTERLETSPRYSSVKMSARSNHKKIQRFEEYPYAKKIAELFVSNEPAMTDKKAQGKNILPNLWSNASKEKQMPSGVSFPESIQPKVLFGNIVMRRSSKRTDSVRSLTKHNSYQMIALCRQISHCRHELDYVIRKQSKLEKQA